MAEDGLRILHVVSAPAAGGAEVYVKQLAVEQRRLGHQPRIAFLDRAQQAGRSPEFERRFLADLKSACVEYFFIGNASRRIPFLGAANVWRLCRSQRIQVYHSHLKYGILFGAFLRIPRFYTHHNSPPGLPIFLFRLFNLLVEYYVGISETCGDLLEGYTGRTATVIRNGVDLSRFMPKLRRMNSKLPISCVSVGRIFDQKNYPLLVRAIALLPRSAREKLHVSIVGEGLPQLVSELEHDIRVAGLTECIHLAGNQIDVPAILDQSRIFLMSSAWEGLPIALLEATASGLPFIATDVGACRELAELCGNGVIVPPDDPQAFADALTDLVENPGKLLALSRAAVTSAATLSIATAARDHLQLYTSVLRGRHNA